MAFFCPNCGTQNSDEDKFCQACGTKLETEDPATEPVVSPAAVSAGEGFDEFVEPVAAVQNDQYSADFVYQDASEASGAPAKKKGNSVPIIIVTAAVVGIVVIVAILMSLNRYMKIDAKELFDIEFAGPDGYGVCYAQLDIDPSFARSEYGVDMKDYSLTNVSRDAAEKKIEYSKYFSDERKQLEKAYPKKSKSEAEELRDALLDVDKEGAFRLSCEPSKANGLSNGDKITIEVEFDEDDLKDNHIKLENTSFEVEVKGLEKAEPLDAFAGLAPKFTGLDGEGYIDYDSLYSEFPFIYCTLDGSGYDHSNGEEITVNAELELYYLDDYNYIDEEDTSKGLWFRYDGKLYVWEYPSTITSKKFKVEGLTELNEVDPADEIVVTYEGAAPFIDINVDVKEDSKFADMISVSLDDSYYDRYNIGDTVTVKVYGWYSLKEAGYKLKGADSDGYAYVTITIGDDVPAYVTADNAAEANIAMEDMFKNAETEIKQKLQGNRSFNGTSYDTSISFDSKCDKVTKMKAFATYIVNNEITDYSSLSYNAAINSIMRVYKVTLKLSDGEQTIYIVASLDNVICTDGEFSTTSSKVNYQVYSKKADALDAIESLAGYTVSSLASADSSSEAPAESSSAAEESSAADESAEDNSTADESAAEPDTDASEEADAS